MSILPAKQLSSSSVEEKLLYRNGNSHLIALPKDILKIIFKMLQRQDLIAALSLNKCFADKIVTFFPEIVNEFEFQSTNKQNEISLNTFKRSSNLNINKAFKAIHYVKNFFNKKNMNLKSDEMISSHEQITTSNAYLSENLPRDNTYKLFFKLIKHGSLKDFKALLKLTYKEANAKTLNHETSTRLLKIALDADETTSYEIVKSKTYMAFALIGMGADISFRSSEKNNTFLIYAAMNGYTAVLRYLLTTDIKSLINHRNKDENTALHLAAHYGHILAVRLLIEKGADVNLKNRDNFTPLDMAHIKNKIIVVEYLKTMGAPLKIASEHIIITPLIKALQKKNRDAAINLIYNSNEETINFVEKPQKTLDDNLSEINSNSNCDMELTALHYAVKWGDLDIVTLLLDKGAKCDATTAKGDTPLGLAAKQVKYSPAKWEKTFNLFKNSGANLKHRNNSLKTLLHLAAEEWNYQACITLLKSQWHEMIYAVDCEGNTPLHSALKSCENKSLGTCACLDIVSLFKKCKANLDLLNYSNQSPRQLFKLIFPDLDIDSNLSPYLLS